VIALALAAMATRFELLLDEEEPVSARAAGEAALAEIAEAENRLSRFRRDSMVARLCADGGPLRRSALGGAPVTESLTLDEVALFEFCRRACVRTGRAFDPGLGGPPFSDYRLDRRARRIAPPISCAPIDAVRALRLDFGGVGKGYALDRAVAVLRENGVERALLHGGTSSVAALGAPRTAVAWRVLLRDPIDRDRALASVTLRGASLSVSAPHGGLAPGATRDAGHVLDPRDGRPVERTLLAAVVARHGVVAEIASTALLVRTERLLCRGEPPTAAALAFTPLLAALVAWEERGARRSLVFGRRPDLFDVRERSLPRAAPPAVALETAR
jgi:thiamine biosynthesis lipoprotein